MTYGHFHYAAATSGFYSVELIDNIAGCYAHEIDFRVHYSVLGRNKLLEGKRLANMCLPSMGQT